MSDDIILKLFNDVGLAAVSIIIQLMVWKEIRDLNSNIQKLSS